MKNVILTSQQNSFSQLHSWCVVCDFRYDFENVFGYVPNMGISKAERLRRGDSMMTYAMVLTAVHTDDVRDFAIRVRSHRENAKVTLQTANFQIGPLPIVCNVAVTANNKERPHFRFHMCAVWTDPKALFKLLGIASVQVRKLVLTTRSW